MEFRDVQEIQTLVPVIRAWETTKEVQGQYSEASDDKPPLFISGFEKPRG